MRIKLTKDIRQEIVDVWGFEEGEGWGFGLVLGAVLEVEGPNEEGGFRVKDSAGIPLNVLPGEFVMVEGVGSDGQV